MLGDLNRSSPAVQSQSWELVGESVRWEDAPELGELGLLVSCIGTCRVQAIRRYGVQKAERIGQGGESSGGAQRRRTPGSNVSRDTCYGT